jgi:hypothetical protein
MAQRDLQTDLSAMFRITKTGDVSTSLNFGIVMGSRFDSYLLGKKDIDELVLFLLEAKRDLL